MHKIRKAYERVVIWLIGKLADTIVRPADIKIVELLDLKPFMHIIRGENGVRHIGIYCDPVWKTLNGFPYMGTEGEMQLSLQREESEQPAAKRKPRRRKSIRR